MGRMRYFLRDKKNIIKVNFILIIFQGEEGGVSVEVENLVTELMENLDQFVLDPAPQVILVMVVMNQQIEIMILESLKLWRYLINFDHSGGLGQV